MIKTVSQLQRLQSSRVLRDVRVARSARRSLLETGIVSDIPKKMFEGAGYNATLKNSVLDWLARQYPHACYDDSTQQWIGLPAAPISVPEEARVAEKGTDVVAEATKFSDTAEVHGGDGHSMEVTDAVQTGHGGNETAQPANVAEVVSPSQDKPDSSETASTAIPDVSSKNNPQGTSGAPAAAQGETPMDKTEDLQDQSLERRGHAELSPESQALLAELEEDECRAKANAQLSAERGASDPTPRGATKQMSSRSFFDIPRGRIDPKIKARVKKALQNWVSDVGDEESMGRMDYAELAIRARVNRSGIARALKMEAGRPALLIMPDVSGSCLGFAPKAHEVARAIAETGLGSVDMVILIHSNGDPIEVSVNGGAAKEFPAITGFSDLSWDQKIPPPLKRLHNFAASAGLPTSLAWAIWMHLRPTKTCTKWV